MSESSLSPPPQELDSDPQELPLNLRPALLGPELPKSASIIFDKGLFRRTLLDTLPTRIQYHCCISRCNYSPCQPITNQSTSNLWKHLKKMHPEEHAECNKLQQSSSIRGSSRASSSAFFEPRKVPVNAVKASKYRELLLAFVVSNNLPLRLVESPSFRQMIHHLNPTVITVGRTTIQRDLYRMFCYHKAKLQNELKQHVINGGRLSLTTDCWSARNYSNYAAVTVHWIDDNWKIRTTILDIVHLQEPIHSGEYLAEQILSVTDDYSITPSIFTVTRDNASANTVMLAEYEKLATKHEVTLQQPWSFTTQEGDVRCIGHIINLAVQAALKSLKAEPAEQVDAYRLEQGAARVPQLAENATVAVLAKLRRHIYVFRNRRVWKDALKKQCEAATIQYRQLSLDMPVRWSSTYHMINTALKLQSPITALCASQQLDPSMRDISLSSTDWMILHSLLQLFNIFVRPTEKLQAASYPTLNIAIPQYIRMIKKLEEMKDTIPEQSPIAEAIIIAIKKLNGYYTLSTNQQRSHSTIATICDPRYNFNIFDIIWDKSTQQIKKNRAKAYWQDCFHRYSSRESDIKATAILKSIEDADTDEDVAQIEATDSEDELYVSRTNIDIEPEWKQWMKEPPMKRGTDILKYWQSKQYQYPIIARIAKDHLAIPATSAESERLFSVGGDIVTKKRNRLSPSTLRYLLCLRSWGIISPGDDSDESDDDSNIK